jgi:hypothetical protein
MNSWYIFIIEWRRQDGTTDKQVHDKLNDALNQLDRLAKLTYITKIEFRRKARSS